MSVTGSAAERTGAAPRPARGVARGAARPARVLEARWAGVLPYAAAERLQSGLVHARRSGGIPDQLLLLEHPHVITLGSASDRSHVLVDAAERLELGLDLIECGRGGDVTYHGPGQLVGYPILDLKPDRKDIHRYLRDLEEVLIRVARGYGIAARRIPGATGVWTDAGKLGAIGVRVSSGWITSHGFALNVTTDLSYFDRIVPCGLAADRVTSLERLTGGNVAMPDVVRNTAEAFATVFGAAVRWAGAPAVPDAGGRAPRRGTDPRRREAGTGPP